MNKLEVFENMCNGCVKLENGVCTDLHPRATGECYKPANKNAVCLGCAYDIVTGCNNKLICQNGSLYTHQGQTVYKKEKEMVNHPDHYQGKNGMEVIDVIDAFTSELSGVEAFDTGNVIKYICRWKEKNGVEDLEKVLWYTKHLIDYVKKNK